MDPAVQIHGSIGFGVQVPRARSKLTPFPHTVLGGTPGHGNELEAAVGLLTRRAAPAPEARGGGVAYQKINL